MIKIDKRAIFTISQRLAKLYNYCGINVEFNRNLQLAPLAK